MTMSELNVLVWNINGNYSLRSYAIPTFIASTLVQTNDMYKTVDIIILTEFVVAPGWCHLKAVLEEYEYSIFTSYASEQNGVLIAINKNIKGLDKKSLETAVPLTEMNTVKDKKPNFLQVTIKYKDNPLNIIGTRIRIEDKCNDNSKKKAKSTDSNVHLNSNKEDQYKKDNQLKFREDQFMALYDHLRSYKKQRVICAGDFNPKCSRKKYNKDKINYYEKKINIMGQDRWCYWWIKDKLKNSTFEIITPDKDKEEGSWVDKNNKMFLNDHIIISSDFNVPEAEYIWKFVTRENGYVKVLNNKKVELNINEDKSYLKGYPDHAILWAKVVSKKK